MYKIVALIFKFNLFLKNVHFKAEFLKVVILDLLLNYGILITEVYIF